MEFTREYTPRFGCTFIPGGRSWAAQAFHALDSVRASSSKGRTAHLYSQLINHLLTYTLRRQASNHHDWRQELRRPGAAHAPARIVLAALGSWLDDSNAGCCEALNWLSFNGLQQAKDAVGAAQQKASEALGSAKETLTGTVRSLPSLLLLGVSVGVHQRLKCRFTHCVFAYSAMGRCRFYCALPL